jgi:hypothetical protein
MSTKVANIWPWSWAPRLPGGAAIIASPDIGAAKCNDQQNRTATAKEIARKVLPIMIQAEIRLENERYLKIHVPPQKTRHGELRVSRIVVLVRGRQRKDVTRTSVKRNYNKHKHIFSLNPGKEDQVQKRKRCVNLGQLCEAFKAWA